MSTPQTLVQALLMKSILGEELIDTKFHLFSGRSAHTSKVIKLQVLSGNNAVLASRSEFFAQLLSKTELPDATFVDFDCDSASENAVVLDDYGYGSDSDLEDENEDEDEDGQLGQTQANDQTLVVEGVSDDSDLLVVADARSKMIYDHPSVISTQGLGAMPIPTPSQHRPRFIDCRSILVRDTAFRTWKALMLYLYTDKINFSPLKSLGQERVDVQAPNSSSLWPCSPKSMYRLACKVRLDGIRDQAFSAIRSGLNEKNVLQELTSSLTLKYPEILQLHIDVLLQHIASIPVIQNIPALVRRIADAQLSHGADIIIGLYQKVLLRYHPQALALANAPKRPDFPEPKDDCPTCRAAPQTPSPSNNPIVYESSSISQKDEAPRSMKKPALMGKKRVQGLIVDVSSFCV